MSIKNQRKVKRRYRKKDSNKFPLSATVIILFSFLLILISLKNFKTFKFRVSGNTISNLVVNPSFEEGGSTKPSDWQYISADINNSVAWVSDEVHSGAKAMKLTMVKPELAPYRYIGVSSNWFKVTPGSLVEASAWWKAQDITWVKLENYPGWYHVRIRLEAYDASRSGQLKVWNFGGQEGFVNEWSKVAGNLIVPESAEYMRLQVWINDAAGILWIDDIEVKEVKTIPQASINNLQVPVVIPQPFVMNTDNSTAPLGSIAVASSLNELFVREELAEFLAGIGKSTVFLNTNNYALRQYKTIIRIGSSYDPDILRQFNSRFRGKRFADLGSEGYFISITKGKQNYIYLAANTQKGRFYALQSLKQLIQNDSVFVVSIFDMPTMGRRGITQPAEWWNQDRVKVVEGSARVKYNYIWYQGEMFSYRMATNWRDSFTEADKTLMSSQSKLCSKHFIDCYFSFRPRGGVSPLIYSSDVDINTIVNKMDVMYSQGVRNFGLSFDDLEWNGENILLAQQDIDKFNGMEARCIRYAFCLLV